LKDSQRGQRFQGDGDASPVTLERWRKAAESQYTDNVRSKNLFFRFERDLPPNLAEKVMQDHEA